MIEMHWDNLMSRADLKRTGGPLRTTDSLTTAVILSIYTWATRRTAGPLPHGQERRGYWADAYDGDDHGCDLWQLFSGSGKSSQDAMELAQQSLKRALAWMLRDGVAAKIDVLVTRMFGDRISFWTIIHSPTGTQYRNEWEATLASP